MSRFALTSLMLVLCLGVVPRDADAYVRSLVPGGSACLYWDTREITWYLNDEGSSRIDDGTDIDAVIASFETWNEPECSDLTFEFGGLTERSDIGYIEPPPSADPEEDDNVNLVVFRRDLCTDVVPSTDPCWDCYEPDFDGPCCSTVYDCWSHSPTAIAITTTTFFTATGKLVDADIELNEARYLFTTGDGPVCEQGPALATCSSDADCGADESCMMERCRTRGCVHTDISNTVTHEVGHVIGLDHSPIPEATMYASAGVGETSKRSLHDNDIQGLCDIYPAGGPTLTCGGEEDEVPPTGCCGGGSGAMLLGLLPALMLTINAGRRERRGRI